MRPVHRDAQPIGITLADYRDAFGPLVGRLGPWCSYCERRIATNLAVEHIQPKGLPQYAGLEREWTNFLLGCVNCNSMKKDKDVVLVDVLLPDRDNTFHAFHYEQDGTVGVRPASASVTAMAERTLALVGLDKRPTQVFDENDRLIATERVSQRMEAWLKARLARTLVDRDPGNQAVRTLATELAAATGFFSIWMAAFEGDIDMRNCLIDAFPGTRGSGCFDPATTQSVSPRIAPAGLEAGGKV